MKLLSQSSPAPKRLLKVGTAQTLDNPLDRLEAATLALLKFQQNHDDIFDHYRDLQEEIAVAEDEVRTYVKLKKRNLESDLFEVEYVPGFRRWYDPDVLLKYVRKLPEAERVGILGLGLIHTLESVNEKVLKTLVKLEKIPKSVMEKAYREQQTQTRATIKRKT